MAGSTTTVGALFYAEEEVHLNQQKGLLRLVTKKIEFATLVNVYF
jgi:hypothetical protein